MTNGRADNSALPSHWNAGDAREPSAVRPVGPHRRETGDVRSLELVILAEDGRVHDRERSELDYRFILADRSVGVGMLYEDLAEVGQAEPMSRLVERNGFHVRDRRIGVDSPRVMIVVVDLPESHVDP